MTRSYPHHQHHRLTPFPVRNAIEEEILIDGVGREEMASGWGVTGNEGRCCDFSDCVSRCREPNRCALLLDDYLECLHHALQATAKPLEIYISSNKTKRRAAEHWSLSSSHEAASVGILFAEVV
ncbi:NADH dehydrogenase ubiquinone iron-sulfur protein [Musa troglodytarum]|uniref:NADH dehydrogenase [ubiquinone] iron-sulfur protein 5 n=1 Tax=Musa troglodytarum TaxID=320322 RepID=A0A9E7ELR0_9LILI|nr:NADH dehydrogenase ubiquinone iron-sulfur protein [Musa troglodytarum]